MFGRLAGDAARHAGVVLCLVAAVAVAADARAQEPAAEAQPALFAEIARRVALDPTTYAPTVVVYTARQLDWSSSQLLFKAGYIEANPGYTISGRPIDTPVSYAAGNRRIARDTIGLLGRSAGNNALSAIVERALIARAPRHRRLIRTLGWIRADLVRGLLDRAALETAFRPVAGQRTTGAGAGCGGVMRQDVGVWIDHKKAVIVSIAAGDVTTRTLQSDVEGHPHYSGSLERGGERKYEVRHDQHLDRYYDQVIGQLGTPDALLLFGPGEAKLQLKERLGRSAVASDRVVAVESTDRLTDPQIVAKVKAHYGLAR